MTRTNRMYKTLSTLAVSMTVGAFLLAGIEPPIAHSGASAILLSATDRVQWEAIVVRCLPVSHRNNKLDNEMRLEPGHWMVGSDLNTATGAAWRDQTEVPGFDRAVVIDLEVGPTGTITPEQLAALDQLLDRISRQADLSTDKVRYITRDSRISDLAAHLNTLRSRMNVLTSRS